MKIKEMGAMGPDKEGVLVDIKDLVSEVQVRLQKKSGANSVHDITIVTNGLDLEAPPEDKA